MIGYVASCVQKFKDELGDDFVWSTPEQEIIEEEITTDSENDGKVTAVPVGDSTEVDEDSGMSAGGVFFLVLFIVAVITAVVYGLYLYRKDRLCFKKNLEKCKSC